MTLRVGIDIGGTFTDFAFLDSATGRFEIGKALSTPDDPSRAVLNGLKDLLEASSLSMSDVDEIVHATTVATNAVIQRNGARTALITTKGFRDLLIIGRQKRWELYDNAAGRAEPLVPRSLVFEVAERMQWNGEVHTPLDEDNVRQLAADIARLNVDSVGVCLLHSYANPAHERRILQILAEELPELPVSLSSDVSPLYREFERASTTVINAYVRPSVSRYVDGLEAGFRAAGTGAKMLIMQSNGGVSTPDTAKQYPIRLIESGPAAGVLTAARYAEVAETDDLISFDMGGTTAKLCLIEGGRPMLSSEFEVHMSGLKKGSGLPINIPSVDLIEIGAGGGSIARSQLGTIAVGPQSAGSSPGPACYGIGGSKPTVTDADLVLGYLNPDYFLGGEMVLDHAAAEAAIRSQVADPLGIDVVKAAWGIHQIVNSQMAEAARNVTISRGKDPRRFALVPFGGAGPVHGARLARILECPTVIFPRAAGVESAVGLLMAEISLHLARTHVLTLGRDTLHLVKDIFARLRAQASSELSRSGIDAERQGFRLSCDMRFAGQGYEIAVDLPEGGFDEGHLEAMREAFFAAYARSYGDRTFDPAWEIVGVHWRIQGIVDSNLLSAAPVAKQEGSVSRALKSTRNVWFPEHEGFCECPVYDRYRLSPGDVIEGPAIVEERESTIVLLPYSSSTVDTHGNIISNLKVGTSHDRF